jgi:hypothetical protein
MFAPVYGRVWTANTMGIVVVACLAASTNVDDGAKMTSTCMRSTTMSSMARIGRPAQMDFVHGQMINRRWDLSLAPVDGQAFRIMLTRSMSRGTVTIQRGINAGPSIRNGNGLRIGEKRTCPAVRINGADECDAD